MLILILQSTSGKIRQILIGRNAKLLVDHLACVAHVLSNTRRHIAGQ